jgi:hypothetical protein
MSFVAWIDTLVDEKEYDLEQRFEIDGPSGMNSIPLGTVIARCKQTTAEEQDQIKRMIIQLDFRGADLLDYFRHLAGALAV